MTYHSELGQDKFLEAKFFKGKRNGVFIELGAKGLIEMATNLGVALDDQMRFINTDKEQRTNVPGIFAAGDICGPPWQVAKAVGEGCVAGLNAADYAKKL